MNSLAKPIVIITHQLPEEWVKKVTDRCECYIGPLDATEFDPLLITQLPRAEGLISLLTIQIDNKVINLAPNLRVVSNMAVGVDNIDIKACTEHGIPVGNTPGVLTDSTADLTMALLLAITRKLPQASRDAMDGNWKTWSPAGWLGSELRGSTLGIVGMGKIGKAVADRARGFGMQIIYTDPEEKDYPGATKVSFIDLLSRSDIVTLHAPLTAQTKGLINKETLSLMKPTSFLINAARGQLVDTSALESALQSKIIAGAALDVTDPEPLPKDHLLYKIPNCLVLPHIGSATYQTRRKMAELACDNLLAGLQGERLPNCVNPEVYL